MSKIMDFLLQPDTIIFFDVDGVLAPYEFDGLKTEAERCKNFNGETAYYWLDTPWERSPRVDSSTGFMIVGIYGWAIHYNSAASTYAVVPCFAIARKPKAGC